MSVSCLPEKMIVGGHDEIARDQFARHLPARPEHLE